MMQEPQDWLLTLSFFIQGFICYCFFYLCREVAIFSWYHSRFNFNWVFNWVLLSFLNHEKEPSCSIDFYRMAYRAIGFVT